jgi:hypothetical protein
MCLTDIVTTSIEPQICVAMPCAILLAVVQYALEDIGNRAVVASTVTRSQDNDVTIPWVPCITFPASVIRYLPVPLWLCLEVTRLRLIILYCRRYYRFPRRIISIIVHWYIAEEPE